MDRVAQLVRDAGVTCVLDTSGGGCATIWAGDTATNRAGATGTRRSPGPAGSAGASGRPPLQPRLLHRPDDDGQTDAVSTRRAGARAAAQVTALIVAQARRADPTQPLRFDEIEALGLDGTGRQA